MEYGQIRRIYNLTLTLADTEYSRSLTGSVRKFTVQCRTAFNMKLSFNSGESGTTFITVKSGQNYYEDLILGADIVLYLQSPTVGVVAEIVAWSDN